VLDARGLDTFRAQAPDQLAERRSVVDAERQVVDADPALAEPVVVGRALERRLEDHDRVAGLRRRQRALGRRTSPGGAHLGP
jgi:hypothetical protein